jgi:hypothetical protein
MDVIDSLKVTAKGALEPYVETLSDVVCRTTQPA